MEFKKAQIDDNLEEIAELIYLTDKYIYPYWFEGVSDYKTILVDLIKSKGSLFYYENILVAKENDNILGIVVFLSSKNKYDYDYSKLISINRNFKYTINNYILPVTKHIEDNLIYVSNVCVNLNKRRKHIGTNLLKTLIAENPGKNFELDVLAINGPAINLYTKMGFKIVDSKTGFNGPYKPKPPIFTMKRNKKPLA